ncbi:MAG TPA: CCA tRNA nucleotidyltransferase [Phycisphaerae bacterium]|nr:CCA tRNA nucleotidyltransferase [Phycisphaerae bacterium]
MTRPHITLEDAGLAIVRRLRAHEHEAFWAGGCVRDMLLAQPYDDIDVATSAPPEEVIRLFTRTRKVGVQFGVVLVRQGPWWIEVATFRADLEYADGRRPAGVVFTTAEEDARRRDFTINGLFYDPVERKVIDHVGGQEDLRNRLVRAIGAPPERFAEDHLRMLRAVRFATRLGFTIEPATAAAITEHAERITRISAERIREELEKMLEAPGRAEAVKAMARLGLLRHLWPDSNWPVYRVLRAVAVLGHLPECADFVLAMAGLLHDKSTADAERIGRALRCSNDQIDHAAWLVANREQIEQASAMSLAEFKKLLAHPRFDHLVLLHEAVCKAAGSSIDPCSAARRRRDSVTPEAVAPPPLVTGEDLIAAGRQPGPQFKRILDTLYDAQLNNELTSREQALQKMRELIMTMWLAHRSEESD